MPTLCIQFQPDRAKQVEPTRVRKLFATIGAKRELVHAFHVAAGRQYINFLFGTRKPSALWALIKRRALSTSTLGRQLRRATIATFEGPSGWSDYLLLHHFDSSQKLERLPKSSGRSPEKQ